MWVVADADGRWFADDNRRERRSCDGMVTVCRLPVVDRLTFSIAVRVCYVYVFRSIKN